MNIQIDNREQHRIQYAKKHYKKHEIEIRQLETADYIFNNDIAFEYKTIPDFINSVQSGRIVEQAIRLNQQFKYPFVIIQGTEQELEDYLNKLYFIRKTRKKNKPQNFNKKNYYGAINSLNCYVTVITCPTQYIAFESMLNQAKKCLDDAPINRKVAKTGNVAYNCLRYCVRGVGPKTAQRIVKDFDLVGLNDVLGLTVNDLSSVKGVSKSKAEFIYNKLHS